MLQLMHEDHAADVANLPGVKATYTETMNILQPDSYDGITIYRVMDRHGNVIDQSQDPRLTYDEPLNMYKVRSQVFRFVQPSTKRKGYMSKFEIGLAVEM